MELPAQMADQPPSAGRRTPLTLALSSLASQAIELAITSAWTGVGTITCISGPRTEAGAGTASTPGWW